VLSKEQNELLTDTDLGTPMGDLVRRYWIPALLSEEIPRPDCPPVQVRILGEELVAFRDSQGKVGLLDEHCSHRGTSLLYGRNEGCGLRCIYHGWKYDVEGKVLETPAEPQGSDFKAKIRHKAYPTKEAAGIVFAYMGPKDKLPLFPNYEWVTVPLTHSYVTKCLLECNYLQGLEGECDSSHTSFLHSTFDPGELKAPVMQNRSPVYDVERRDFGLRIVAIRRLPSGEDYVRISTLVMPTSCWISSRLNREVHFYVPIDDRHAWRYDLGFRFDNPVTEGEVHRRKQIGPGFRKIRNRSNHYLQDREAQRSRDFTGIEDFLNEDACATESMGPICDRTREHLGASDQGVIELRRFLLEALTRLQAGQNPPHLVSDPERNSFRDIDAVWKVLPPGEKWRDHFPHLT
jgi:nitrite reductase/ring-hydroxylating ferredoxin subunit